MKNIILASLVVISSASISFAKGDATKGKLKAATCVACHGATGTSLSPMFPNLAGQHEAYLVKQIKAFKSGVRKDPMMAPVVASLTDADIDNLAAFFSKQTK